MAKVKIQGHASGTGILTVTAPNTSTDRTITLPDATGTLLNSDGSAASLTAIPAANITGTLPAIDGSNLTGIASSPFTGSGAAYTYTHATNPFIQVIDSTNTVKAQMQGGNTSAVFGSASDHPVAFIAGASETTVGGIATTGAWTMPLQPSFRAYKTATNTGGGLDWNGTYHNVGSHFNASNGRFTAPVDGVYLISVHFITDDDTDQTDLTLNLNSSADNGVRLRSASSSGHETTSACHAIYLSANDYILPSFGGGGHVYGDANKSWTEFSGHLLG